MSVSEPDTSNKPPVERALNYARAVDMAMAGATNAQIATDLKVDVTTISRFFNSGQGQAALRASMLESMDRTDRFAQTAHAIALRTLVRAMNEAERWGDKINAARAITSLQVKRIEISGALQADEEVSEAGILLKSRLDNIRERHAVIEASIVDATEVNEEEDNVLPYPALAEPVEDTTVAPETVQQVQQPKPRPRVRTAFSVRTAL